jgi:hypothetical protein
MRLLNFFLAFVSAFLEGKKQHEAAACSQESPAKRAGGQRTFINRIDVGVGDLGT